MYEVQNLNTQHIYFKTNDLNLAKKYFNRIPRRKYCHIHIVDTETYEVVAHKEPTENVNVFGL